MYTKRNASKIDRSKETVCSDRGTSASTLYAHLRGSVRSAGKDSTTVFSSLVASFIAERMINELVDKGRRPSQLPQRRVNRR